MSPPIPCTSIVFNEINARVAAVILDLEVKRCMDVKEHKFFPAEHRDKVFELFGHLIQVGDAEDDADEDLEAGEDDAQNDGDK